MTWIPTLVEDLQEDDRIIYCTRPFVVASVEVGERVRVGLCSVPFDGRGPTIVSFARGQTVPGLPPPKSPGELFASNLAVLVARDGRSKRKIAAACWPEADPWVAVKKLDRALGIAAGTSRWPSEPVIIALMGGLKIDDVRVFFTPEPGP